MADLPLSTVRSRRRWVCLSAPLAAIAIEFAKIEFALSDHLSWLCVLLLGYACACAFRLSTGSAWRRFARTVAYGGAFAAVLLLFFPVRVVDTACGRETRYVTVEAAWLVKVALDRWSNGDAVQPPVGAQPCALPGKPRPPG